MPSTLNEFLEKALKSEPKKLDEAKDWKNDPWGARDEAIDKAEKLLNGIRDKISPSESLFFYENKDTAHAKKHRAEIGKKIMALQKAVSMLEKI